MCASVNDPGAVTFVKVPSNIPTRPLWKSVAYNRLPLPSAQSASPLKTASSAAGAATSAVVSAIVEFQPRIRPSSVAKINCAGAEVVPFVTAKVVPMLATAPVGAFATPTVSGTLLPSAR
jgi:hypothetical protein